MKPTRRRALVALATAAAAVALPARAWTQRPVRFVVIGPAGGTSDLVARLMSEALARKLGTPVVVENKPGAGGAIAAGTVIAAPADGQTLLVGAQNVLTEVPLVLKVDYDPLLDLKPLADVGRGPLVLVVHPGVPAANVAELVAYARRNKGKVSYASYSPGTASHFAGLMLNKHAGLDMQHIPYKGSPPALTDLLGAMVPIMFDGLPTALPHVRAGKLRALAVTGAKRSALLPEVPTLAESGYPEIVFENWIGVMGSSKLATPLTARIHEAVREALRDPKLRQRLAEAGLEPSAPMSPAELDRSVRADHQRNAGIVRAFGIRFE